jgi:taurine dioxygenase
MQTRFLKPFGVEISGIQLAGAGAGAGASAGAGAARVDEIVDLVARHRVAVFRQQTSSDTELVAFLKLIGDLTFTAGEVPVSQATDLNIVSNIGRTTPPRSVFHSDTSYVAAPPSLGILKAVVLPRIGGSTLFSNQVAAAARLPDRVIDWLKGRTIEHSAPGPGETILSARHPVLRRHPLTGETALFLSTPARCKSLSGVSEAVSRRVISILYRRSLQPSSLYSHDWRDGDIVCWDNRTTMHRADHGSVSGDRVLHRGLVTGEIPLAAHGTVARAQGTSA